jgi:opacity protein-like surface antigen
MMGVMMNNRTLGFAAALLLSSTAAQAQVAPVPYYLSGGPFGFGGTVETQSWGSAPDENGFRKGFAVTSFEIPLNSFASSLAPNNPWSNIGAFGGSSSLAVNGAQYGYSFKGLGDTPVTLFGSVSSLRTTPDVFNSLITPGFDNGRSLATSVSAGIEFKPTSNISLSLSAGVTQPSAENVDTDLRSQMLRGAR